MRLKVLFANIFQGMIFAGYKPDTKEHVFTGWRPAKYIEHFKPYDCDICCFAEMVLDDEQGNSAVVKKMSSEYGLPYYQSLIGAKSWVVEGKYYGQSLLSRYRFGSYEVIKLPNPDIQIVKPNGVLWVMHDKFVQKAVIEVSGRRINVFNVHGFPFHHFNRSVDEAEFAPIRQKMVEILLPDDKPTIITGDFNNCNIEIAKAFPELFENGRMLDAVIDEHGDGLGEMEGRGQLDHILISKHFKIIQAKVDVNYSDHPAMFLEVEMD